jgi:hypothetical protein
MGSDELDFWTRLERAMFATSPFGGKWLISDTQFGRRHKSLTGHVKSVFFLEIFKEFGVPHAWFCGAID